MTERRILLESGYVAIIHAGKIVVGLVVVTHMIQTEPQIVIIAAAAFRCPVGGRFGTFGMRAQSVSGRLGFSRHFFPLARLGGRNPYLVEQVVISAHGALTNRMNLVLRKPTQYCVALRRVFQDLPARLSHRSTFNVRQSTN